MNGQVRYKIDSANHCHKASGFLMFAYSICDEISWKVFLIGENTELHEDCFQTFVTLPSRMGLTCTLIFAFILQVMFETYQFSGVYVAIQAVLTLYAQGRQR